MVKELEVPKKSSSSKVVMLCLLLVLVTMSYCSYSIYRGFADFPEWAEKEVVYTRYADLITSIESEIKNANSLYDLAAKLEKLPRVSDILYMEIEHVPGKPVGYGSRNSLDTVVIMLAVEHLPQVNHVLFHLEHKAQK